MDRPRLGERVDPVDQIPGYGRGMRNVSNIPFEDGLVLPVWPTSVFGRWRLLETVVLFVRFQSKNVFESNETGPVGNPFASVLDRQWLCRLTWQIKLLAVPLCNMHRPPLTLLGYGYARVEWQKAGSPFHCTLRQQTRQDFHCCCGSRSSWWTDVSAHPIDL